MAENKFIESSKIRSELLRKKHHHIRQLAEERNEFWSSLKTCLGVWDCRVERLLQTYGDKSSLNESEKRKLQMDLNSLKEDLSGIRKLCLFSPSASEENGLQIGEQFCRPPPPELPFGDLRLLQEEFQRRQDTYCQVKKGLLPKGKFVFHRYRKAVELLRSQGKDLSQMDSAQLFATDVSQSRKQAIHSHIVDVPGSTLHSLVDASIEIDENGQVRLQSTETTSTSFISSLNLGGTIVVRDISRCVIKIAGSFPSIHLVNVYDSSISIAQAVSGAVHVTNCHRSRLEFRSQQLRLHDSTDILCYTSAATILENCQRIIFYQEAKDPEPDIKDFSFLKKGVASPNFAVEPLSFSTKVTTTALGKDIRPRSSLATSRVPSQGMERPISKSIQSIASSDADGESDEEL